MELKWGIFAPAINEVELIEAKIEWALGHDFAVSICEGHHPSYANYDNTGLSVDGTKEILKSYDDRITYLPIGKVQEEMYLRDYAYKGLPEDIDIAVMCDIDEFYLDKDLEKIEEVFYNKNIKHVLTDSYIFLDNDHCAPYIKRIQSPPFPYNKEVEVHYGQWHERIFRYNKYYAYYKSPFLINDVYGRFLFNDPAYFNERVILPDVFMLHYKNFKLVEAKKRTEMYDTYADGVKHDTEWGELEARKITYNGEHPVEIQKLLLKTGG